MIDIKNCKVGMRVEAASNLSQHITKGMVGTVVGYDIYDKKCVLVDFLVRGCGHDGNPTIFDGYYVIPYYNPNKSCWYCYPEELDAVKVEKVKLI